MKTGNAEIYDSGRYLLGEGPFYDVKRDEMSWVDIKTGSLYIKNAAGELRSLQTGQYLGAALPMVSGGFVGCMTTGLYLLEGDALSERLGIPDDIALYQRFNDAKCDPRGRLFAGTMPLFMKYAKKGGGLYRVEKNKATRLDIFVIVPNGMAWTSNERIMYLVDTAFGNIDAFDYDADTGEISNRRTVIHVERGAPDGMTIDAEDKLWVAIWGGGQVRRYDPLDGSVLETVCTGVTQTSSCCFGGKDLHTLFITTSAENDHNPNAGCVFSYHTEVEGTASIPYNDR